MPMSNFDDHFDVIIVGYGFAGAAAAVSAHDAGARVLLLEKADNPGGISICSAGGVRISRDLQASFEYLKATNAGTTPDACLSAFAQGLTETEAFIRDMARINNAEVGVRWAKANYPLDGGDSFGFVTINDIPGFEPERDFTWGRGLRGGTRLFKVMQDNVASRAIEVRLGTPAVGLISEDGRISGLIAGGKRICAKQGVILACGGFEGDPTMQAQFWQAKPVLSGAYGGNTGDGVRMAQAAGADLWHMWHFHGTYGFRHPDPDVYPYGIRLHRLPDWVPGKPGEEAEINGFFSGGDDARMPWIVVDQRGRRYMNEYPPYVQDTAHRAMSTFDPDTQSYARIPSWMIVDADGLKRGPLGFPAYNDPGVDFAWSDDNAAELDLGILKQAGSIEKMAHGMGCDADLLGETIQRWNTFCQNGHDRDHARLPATMLPIETPPYTYGELWPICANTQGGPRHDERQRVLNPYGQVIEGLYVAGELGSIFGHLYMSGGNLAECFIGGRRAAFEACGATR
ncbi:MAG: FAD-binding protein [Rhodospirillaceae bacterium]|nr:FAD-binding protein [Rhodospirillaceae bacterium]